jgi:tripartite ATP-independent transporter DctM subunit
VKTADQPTTGPDPVTHEPDSGRLVPWIRFANRLVRDISIIVQVIAVAALVAEVIVVLSNITLRTFFARGVPAVDDLDRLMLSVVAFIGAAASYAAGREMRLTVVQRALRRPMAEALDSIIDIVVLVSASALCLAALQLVELLQSQQMPELHTPRSLLVWPIVIGNALIAFYALRRLLGKGLKGRLRVIVPTCLLIALAGATSTSWLGLLNLTTFDALLLGVFVVALAAGVPIGLIFGSIALAYLYGAGEPITTAPSYMQDSLSSPILIALPFFILAGLIMLYGGMAQHLSRFVLAGAGRVRGGAHQALLVGMMIFSGISGSKLADIVALGTMVKDMTADEEFNKEETAAVLAAAAIAGETIPPSIALIVIASITSVSTAALFAAGLGPAALLALMMAVIIAIRNPGHAARARARQIRLGQVLRLGVRAAPALLLPVLLIIGITAGFGTPSEVSSLAVAYGFAATVATERKADWKAWWQTLTEALGMAGMVLWVISNAAAFSWMLTIQQIPQTVTTLAIDAVGHNKIGFLLVTIALLVLLGMALEGLPALLILVPVLFPSVLVFGISPVQYSIVLILAMGLGAFLPPVGIGSYVAASVSGGSVERLPQRLWPYIVVLLLGIIAIALYPPVSLALPELLKLRTSG